MTRGKKDKLKFYGKVAVLSVASIFITYGVKMLLDKGE